MAVQPAPQRVFLSFARVTHLRSLLAGIVVAVVVLLFARPQTAQAQNASPSDEPEPIALVASVEAIEAKRKELKQLLEVDIPKTLKGINAAAAEGDLVRLAGPPVLDRRTPRHATEPDHRRDGCAAVFADPSA